MQPAEKEQTEEVEINLIDYAILLLKRKKLILGITLSCVGITAIVGLLLPRTYRAETRILPPQQMNSGVATQLLSQVAGGLTGLGGMLGGSSQADLYVGMLQSRTVLDSIIKRFDLKTRYSVNTSEDARKILRKKVNVQSEAKSNVVVLSAEDRDPQKSAEIANAFIEELRGMTKTLAVTEAAQRRLFFEEQLKDTRETLIRAEESMKGFQEKTGVLHVEEQVKAVIKSIAQLRAEIAAREVEIRVIKTYAKPSNPDLQKAEAALSGMKAELTRLESRKGAGNDPLMATSRIPSVGTEYIRKLRDLKFNETLYELLLKQYEIARLDEARDASVIQVIDRAVTPEKKVKPKISSMVIIAALASLFFSIGLVLFLERRNSIIHDPVNRERIEQLKKYATG